MTHPEGFIPTGFLEQVQKPRSEEPKFNKVTGDHYWIAIVTYKIDPEKNRTILDHESLIMGPSIACYFCEEPYSERLAKRRCKPVNRE